MAEKKSTTRKKKTPTTERSKKDPRRLANGDFNFGNEIGKETRFKEGNTVHPAPIGNDYSLKYDDEGFAYITPFEEIKPKNVLWAKRA